MIESSIIGGTAIGRLMIKDFTIGFLSHCVHFIGNAVGISKVRLY